MNSDNSNTFIDWDEESDNDTTPLSSSLPKSFPPPTFPFPKPPPKVAEFMETDTYIKEAPHDDPETAEEENLPSEDTTEPGTAWGSETSTNETIEYDDPETAEEENLPSEDTTEPGTAWGSETSTNETIEYDDPETAEEENLPSEDTTEPGTAWGSETSTNETIEYDDDETWTLTQGDVHPNQNKTLTSDTSTPNVEELEITSVQDSGKQNVTIVQTSSTGEEVVTVVDLSSPPLTVEQATEITTKIKASTNVLYLLIKRAHAGRAYAALGYPTFSKYVSGEFNFSRSYAYKLLNQANVIEAIEKVVPEGTEVFVGEGASRSLLKSLPNLLEDIEEHTTPNTTPEEAKEVIEESIREIQEKEKKEKAYREHQGMVDDYLEKHTNDDDLDTDATSYYGDNIPPQYDEENDVPVNEMEFSEHPSQTVALNTVEEPEMEFPGEEDPTVVVQKLEDLWSLINGLQNLTTLAQKNNIRSLLPLLPHNKRAETSRMIVVSVEWLNTLQKEWDLYYNAPLQDEKNIEDEEFELTSEFFEEE